MQKKDLGTVLITSFRIFIYYHMYLSKQTSIWSGTTLTISSTFHCSTSIVATITRSKCTATAYKIANGVLNDHVGDLIFSQEGVPHTHQSVSKFKGIRWSSVKSDQRCSFRSHPSTHGNNVPIRLLQYSRVVQQQN